MSGVISPQAYGYSQGNNLMGMANQVQQFQANQLAMQQRAFELGQAQLQPAYAGLVGLMGDPELNGPEGWNRVNAVLGQSRRIGANTDGLTTNAVEAAEQGMSPRQFVEMAATRYVPPGMAPEMAIGHGVSPEQYYSQIPAYWDPRSGQMTTAPWGSRYMPGWGGGGPAQPAPAAGGGSPGAARPVGAQGQQGASGGPQAGDQGTSPEAAIAAGAGGGAGPRGSRGSVNALTGLPWAPNSFLGRLSMLESNNQNVYSNVDPDVAGPGTRSQGYFQVNTPTASEYGAGLDMGGRGAMALSPQEQATLVSRIPLARFGPRTIAGLEAQYGPLDRSMTVGQLAARFDQGAGGTQYAQNMGPGAVMTDVGYGGGGAGGGGIWANTSAAAAPAAGGGAPSGGMVPIFGPGGTMTMPPPGAIEAARTAAAGATGRQQTLVAQASAAPQQIGLLQQLQSDLAQVQTGVGSNSIGFIRQIANNFGLAPSALDTSTQQAAQESFNKVASQIAAAQMGVLGGPSDARQDLASHMNPSLANSKLGNERVVGMLIGNQQAIQVMNREWESTGQSPAAFDNWRDEQFLAPHDFTSYGKTYSGQYDPRVFWLANMPSLKTQQEYINTFSGRSRAELINNLRYAESKGWLSFNADNSLGVNPP